MADEFKKDLPETAKSVPLVGPVEKQGLTDARIEALENTVSRLIEVFRRGGMLHEFHMDQIYGLQTQLRSDRSGDEEPKIGNARLLQPTPPAQFTA